ncbi:hypothetical protein [Microbacterium sp. KHB019]|uniref:hypothetical protein n=1 Tax=Microbacterium sp. KHB019 TaxID=3129770 RepID=UPI003078B5BC
MRLERPSFTVEYPIGAFEVPPGTAFVHGTVGFEPRNSIARLESSGPVYSVTQIGVASIQLSLADDEIGVADLFDQSALRQLLSVIDSPLLMDITSMDHIVWAPLVKTLVQNRWDFRVMYLKPDDYRRTTSLGREFWELSDEIEGLAPLPGFISISPDDGRDFQFVPLLGFEGHRFDHVLVAREVDSERVIPVIGSPGFRPEYATETVLANRAALERDFIFARQEFAAAACPFDLFFLIEHLRSRHPEDWFVIAPIGTKPHALGAVLQAIRHPADTELVYDHPKRRKDRSSGGGRICVYDLTAFAREYLNA